MREKINVLIVDDSAVVRQVLSGLLDRAPDITVMAAVADPIFAMERMKQCWPDVIVLDVEMPRMDGITFLKKIMSQRPTPVVVCSTLTQEGADTTMQALSAGAAAVVCKPTLGLKTFLQDSSSDLLSVVRGVANARVKNLVAHQRPPIVPEQSRRTVRAALAHTTERVVAIGTSTGGTQALEAVLTALPGVAPGIVIVQHMPERFTAMFAERLDKICQIQVREAQSNDRVLPGRALIAPGGRHMRMRRDGAYYYVDVIDGPPVNRHRPSVDVLFSSVAKAAGVNAAGFIMTGMGGDGAGGLLEMRTAGACTIAQDEETCVVFGMPAAAIARGAVESVLPLEELANEIMCFAARPQAVHARSRGN